MFTKNTVSILARITPSAIGQEQLFSYAGSDMNVIRQLASNPALSPAIWDRLWEIREAELSTAFPLARPLIAIAKLPYQISKALTESELDTLADALMDSEYDPSPDLSRAICEKLVSATDISPYQAAAAIQSGALDPALFSAFLEVVQEYVKSPDNLSGSDLVALILETAITKYDLLSDQEALTLLGEHEEERYTIARVLDARPSLIEVAMKSKYAEEFYSEIAASRHLFEPLATELFREIQDQELDIPGKTYLMQALNYLLANANVSHSTRAAAKALLLQAIEDGGDESSLLLPWEDEPLGRLGASMKLDASLSSNLSTWQTAQGANLELLKHSINYLGFWRYPTLSKLPQFQEYQVIPRDQNESSELTDNYVANQLSPYLDTLGPTAWYLFISLLPDWDQGVKELLAVVNSNLK